MVGSRWVWGVNAGLTGRIGVGGLMLMQQLGEGMWGAGSMGRLGGGLGVSVGG